MRSVAWRLKRCSWPRIFEALEYSSPARLFVLVKDLHIYVLVQLWRKFESTDQFHAGLKQQETGTAKKKKKKMFIKSENFDISSAVFPRKSLIMELKYIISA